jgi:hypothetical protein
VQSGTVTRSAVGQLEIETAIPFAEPKPDEYLYVRIVQRDGGLAWSSPIFID